MWTEIKEFPIYQMVNLVSKVCGMAGVDRSEVEQVYLNRASLWDNPLFKRILMPLVMPRVLACWNPACKRSLLSISQHQQPCVELTCCRSWSVLSRGPAAAARDVNCSINLEFSRSKPQTSSCFQLHHNLPLYDVVPRRLDSCHHLCAKNGLDCSSDISRVTGWLRSRSWRGNFPFLPNLNMHSWKFALIGGKLTSRRRLEISLSNWR